ncbi:MAG: Uma2 family endonuclease [Roseiflexaceae bacterium]
MATAVEPQIHLWTRREYNQLAQIGMFTGKRVELIEGQVIVMSPMGSLHATAIALAARALEPAFGPGYFTRWQMPFAIGERSEPEPDLAVIQGDVRDYVDDHPSIAALLVEVADTSLAYDRDTKGSLYAGAGVADYWIINLAARQLEVYRRPISEPSAAHGFVYGDKAIFRAGDTLSPLAQSGALIKVADLLP